MFRAAQHTVELRVQRPPDAPTASARRAGAAHSSAGTVRSDGRSSLMGELSAVQLDPVARMRRALLELAAEAARGVEADYFRFLESKQGDAYISRLLVKRVLIGTKSDTSYERPLSELSDVPMSVLVTLSEDVAEDTSNYASGW